MPADLAPDHSPAMALPVSVTLVALTTKLLRISRKHRLNCRSPGLQAQPVEATLELLKPLNHQARQRQRTHRQRRPLVHRLQSLMFRHGVDLLALGLRFATSSLLALGDRRLPPYFNSERDLPGSAPRSTFRTFEGSGP